MTDALLNHCQDLADAGQYDEAYRITNKKLKSEPDNPLWLNVLAHLMLETEKPVIAYQVCKRITQIAPKLSTGWLNLGVACRDMRLDKEALRYSKRAYKLADNPQSKSLAAVNVSSVLIDMGEFKEAEGYCIEAQEANPESEKATMNLGFAQLAQRKWEDGWQNYRAIIGHDWRPRFQYAEEPLWDGVSRGTIVLHGEQGLGDQISFASMLPDMMKWCDENESRLIVECDPRLENLYRRSFPNLTVYGTLGQQNAAWAVEDQKVDYSLPMGQIGEYFRKDDNDFPGDPYLVADPDRVLQWKALFESKEKPVIGLAWSSGIFKTGSKFRRVDLETLLPVLKSINAHWVTLQYKPAGREIDNFKAKHPEIDIVEYSHGTLTKDYDDTVSMVAAMDLVFAMHTTVCHVAGGIGVPCWTLVPKNSQWRYGSAGEDYPWAKSLRLIRQNQPGKWHNVLKRTAEDLRVRFSGISETAA